MHVPFCLLQPQAEATFRIPAGTQEAGPIFIKLLLGQMLQMQSQVSQMGVCSQPKHGIQSTAPQPHVYFCSVLMFSTLMATKQKYKGRTKNRWLSEPSLVNLLGHQVVQAKRTAWRVPQYHRLNPGQVTTVPVNPPSWTCTASFFG